jgi:hypothetical protein
MHRLLADHEMRECRGGSREMQGNFDVTAHDQDALFAINNGDGQPAPMGVRPAGIGAFGLTVPLPAEQDEDSAD